MTITIIANPGPFESIPVAAESEALVNFWDADQADDDACTEGFAAMELARFLTLATKTAPGEIELAWPEKLPEQGYVFVLGNRASNPFLASLPEPGKAPPHLTDPGSFRIRILARAEATYCLIEGSGRAGVLYGVYHYLQLLGMRWFGLGEQGTVYPARPAELPTQPLELVEEPAYLTRGFYAWEDRGNREFFLWMARNKMNYWTAADQEVPFLKKLGMRLAVGAHDLQTGYLNPQAEYPYRVASQQGSEKLLEPYQPSPEALGDNNGDGKLTYFEAHPEWYGLQGGKRSDRVKGDQGDNFCTANPDAVTELTKNLIEGLTTGRWSKADIVNFWMEDAGKWCQCEECAGLGTPTDRLLLLLYQVNKGVQQARADAKLQREVAFSTLAYTETRQPPTRPLPADFDYAHCSVTFYPIGRCYTHSLADPNCTEFNKHYADAFSGWAPKSGGAWQGALFLGEYYNVSVYKSLPALYWRTMALDIPWYWEQGARHFHYMHTLTSKWGTWTLNQYLLARLLWAPYTDVAGVLDDYFAQYYPTTTVETRRFYAELESALVAITPLKATLARRLNTDQTPFPLDHMHYEEYHPAKNDGPDFLELLDSLERARAALNKALGTCQDDLEKARLLEDERRFAYAEATVDFLYRMTCLTVFEQQENHDLARYAYEKLEAAAERLKQFDRSLIETYGCPDDGLAATLAQPKYEALQKKYGEGQSEPAAAD